MLSSDFLFPRFFVVPLANPSNFSHCKCFSSRIIILSTAYSTPAQDRKASTALLHAYSTIPGVIIIIMLPLLDLSCLFSAARSRKQILFLISTIYTPKQQADKENFKRH